MKLTDRVTVEPYRQVPPTGELGEDLMGVSGIGTIAAARVLPHGNEEESFVAVSMYASWLSVHPSYQQQLDLLRRLRTSDHFGLVHVHWSLRSCEAQDLGCGRSEHVLRVDRLEVVAAGARAHGVG